MTLWSRLPVVATLVTLTAVVIMFALGFWQLQRADEKSERLAAIQQAAETKALSLQQASTMGQQALDMTVQFNGRMDTKRYFLLDNKIQQGTVGYEVLAIVSATEGNVIVNLGWLAAPPLRSDLPQVNLNDTIEPYQGIVAIPKHNTLITETAARDQQWPKVLQQADLAVIEQHYASALLPFVILLDEQQGSGYVRKWQAVVMPPEKHLAYAIQWFLLASAALVIFIVAQHKKLNRGSA